MRIKQIWEELENDKSFQQGLLIRRYSSSILPDVFVALQQPEKMLCIAASFSTNVKINVSFFANLQEIKVEVLPDVSQNGKNILLLKLINNQHKEIFAVLSEDLILSISEETNEKKLISALLTRLEKWKLIFQKFTNQSLSLEQQRGLFGELIFLRKYLNYNFNFHLVIDSWKGPEKEVRDFQNKSWAVEVKTTFGNNHQKVKISSERQLDSRFIKNLYLFHLSLEKVQQNGESLPELVNSILEILNTNLSARNLFCMRLLEASYFHQQAHLYIIDGYFIRQENFYEVVGDFPRLQENELRNGVGDVKYSIIISQCQQYLQTEKQVLETLSI